jgi:hypothetical protein
MSSKGIGLLFIGIILGSAVGYGVSIVFPAYELGLGGGVNYRVEYEALVEQHQTLQDQIDALTDNHDALTEEFEALTSLYEGLDENHTALMETYNESVKDYDDLLMQYEIITGTSPLTVRQISDDVKLKEYAWLYNDETWTLSLTIPKDLYEYYTNRTRIVTEDYSIYVTHPNDDEYISKVVEAFYDIAAQEGYSSQQTVNLVISFVQSLPYTSDDVTTAFDEYVRYPLETLVDGGGDCEDTSILTSALLDAMNNEVVLLNFPGHVAVGVNVDVVGSYFSYEGEHYYYLETTGEGWEIGVIPTEYQGTPAVIYPILPVVICTHQWTASQVGHKITIVAKVKNEGTKDARGLKLWAAFDGRNDIELNPETSEFFDLDIEGETTVMIVLNVPRDIRSRLIVRVQDAFGNTIDESFSEWFNTG